MHSSKTRTASGYATFVCEILEDIEESRKNATAGEPAIAAPITGCSDEANELIHQSRPSREEMHSLPAAAALAPRF